MLHVQCNTDTYTDCGWNSQAGVNALTIEGQEGDARGPQRLHEFREEESSVLVLILKLSIRWTIDSNGYGPIRIPTRCPEVRSLDLSEADVRHALRDQLQETSICELGVVECPTIQRKQDVQENFVWYS